MTSNNNSSSNQRPPPVWYKDAIRHHNEWHIRRVNITDCRNPSCRYAVARFKHWKASNGQQQPD